MLLLRPTFSESWYRVANLKVRLRPSAQITRQYYRGERWYVARDPAGNQYHRLSDPAYRFCALLDGNRTINEAWELVGGTLDDEAPTQPEVIQILSQLYAANLIEADVSPDSGVLLKRHRNLMKRKFQQRLMNTLFPRIPIWDPDRYLQRWMPVFAGLMSWWGAAVWLLVVGFGVYKIAPMWTELKLAASDSINPANWFYLWLVFVVTKFIHEMGHASSCRRFGGECHEMGVMFLVFIPTPYVDASSAWSFPNRWKRMFVGAAGMTIEIFFAAICAVIWANTYGTGEPWAKLINQLAYNAMLIASVSTVLFNANPLLRYDGYYMLSDFLEIPNLQKKSTDYTMGLIKRHLFRVKAREPLPSISTRGWLFVYSVTSSVYRIFIGLMIIVLVAFQVPILGILMSVGGLITWIGMPLYKTLKYLLIEPELHRKRGRAWGWTLLGVGLATVLIGAIPMPLRVHAEGVVEPLRRQAVYTEAPGFVTELAVVDGQQVKPGDVLIRLQDDTLLAQTRAIRASLNAAQLKLRASRSRDPAQAQADEYEVATYTHQLAEFERRLALLEVRATVAGEVVAPKLKELVGRYVPKGQQVMLVADPRALVVRTLVTQGEAELVPTDGSARTEVRVAGSARTSILSNGVEVVVAASDRLPHPLLAQQGGGEYQADPSDPNGGKSVTKQFELRVRLPSDVQVPRFTGGSNAADELVPVQFGQRAYVKLFLPPRTIWWQVTRRVEQLFESNKAGSKWF